MDQHYKLTYRQNGQTKTTGIAAGNNQEARDKTIAFIQAKNLPLRAKGFNANPAYIELVAIEEVPVCKVIRIDDECFKALQDRAAALNEPFKPVGEILRICLGLDADPSDAELDKVSPEAGCPKCGELETDNLINNDGHIRCTGCGCEYDLGPERAELILACCGLPESQCQCDKAASGRQS